MLGAAAATVARNLDMLAEPFELVLAGGLFHGASDMLEKAISRKVPTALDEAVEQGKIKQGDLLLMTALGGGLAWASAAVRW